jgi:hypothetical protein
MKFDGLDSDDCYAFFRSPSVLKEGIRMESVEELKNTSVLPRERLLAAAVWVHFTANQLTGLRMHVPKHISWDEEQKTWVWKLKWKNVMAQFYETKKEQRLAKLPSTRVIDRAELSKGRTRTARKPMSSSN